MIRRGQTFCYVDGKPEYRDIDWERSTSHNNCCPPNCNQHHTHPVLRPNEQVSWVDRDGWARITRR